MSTRPTSVGTIARAIGGPENVSWVGSCTTRLRFVVKDDAKVDLPALNEAPGVLQAIRAGGQVQVVIGTDVDDVKAALLAEPGWRGLRGDSGAGSRTARRTPIDAVFDFLGGTFQPLIPVITGAAMVQVLTLLLTQFAGLDATRPTALILTATGNAIFYFLPLFVAFTASKKLGANPFIGTAIAAALLHPDFTSIGETGTVTAAFGMPLFVYSYASSMFPALLLSLALAGVDRILRRWLPKPLQQVFVPTIELLLLVPLTALVFGPVGVLVGNGIAAGTQWLATSAPFVFYILVPALWLFLVAFGIHWALISIAIGDLAIGGSSAILGAAVGYQYAVLGVALAVLIHSLRTRDATLRGTITAATIAVAIGGITEPMIYGFLLRYRRLLIIEVIAAAASGLVLGLFDAKMFGFSPAPLLGMPLMQPLAGAAVALVVAVVVPLILVPLWGRNSLSGQTPASAAPGASSDGEAAGMVFSPMEGDVLPLSESGEAVFGGGVLGPGICIVPRSERVVAPFDGVVVALPSSAHAVGVSSVDGTEVLVHVGVDTVKFAGRYFTPRVEQGQQVRRGDVLIEFDRAGLEAEGVSVVTPVVVTNHDEDGREVELLDAGRVREGDPILRVRVRAH